MVPIVVPDLLDRREDIPLLVEEFVVQFVRKGLGRKGFAPEALQLLQRHAWPGNVRELVNFMERLSILVDGDTVCMEDLPHKILDQVGDVALLPPVEEISPVEAQEQPAQETSGQEAPAQESAAASAQTPMGQTVVVASDGVFVWPNLGVLAEHGLNLKDFGSSGFSVGS